MNTFLRCGLNRLATCDPEATREAKKERTSSPAKARAAVPGKGYILQKRMNQAKERSEAAKGSQTKKVQTPKEKVAASKGSSRGSSRGKKTRPMKDSYPPKEKGKSRGKKTRQRKQIHTPAAKASKASPKDKNT